MPCARLNLTIPLRELLPEVAFVPFDAQRLADPWIAYSQAPHTADEALLNEFSYLIPSDIDGPDHFTSDTKRFYAERYGGPGLMRHGGGARVGLSGTYEVKGIGTNPLCDAGPPSAESAFWHSHGGLALVDAILEAVWAQVLSIALPYGATRIPALIGTGTLCWHKTSRGDYQAPRALVIREAALRPAHFFRTPFFRASPALKLAPDRTRVALAINRLPYLFPFELPPDALLPHADVTERLRRGLWEFVRRSAEQCASARAKRLMHGAANASNVTLDGRWVDLGSTSALPNYANTHNLGWGRELPTLWEDHLPFLRTIGDLCFYITKYLHGATSSVISSRELTDHFLSTYEAALRRSFVLLTGVPEQLYRNSLPEAAFRTLAETLISVARYGVSARFLPTVPDLTKYGSNTLGLSLITAAMHQDAGCYNRLARLIHSGTLCDKFYSGYSSLIGAARKEAEHVGISNAALQRVILLNAARSALPAETLYRPLMYRHCERLVLDLHSDTPSLRAAIQDYVDDAVAFARTILAPEPATTCAIWEAPSNEVTFDARLNTLRLQHDGQLRYAPWEAISHDVAQDASSDLYTRLRAVARKLAGERG